MYIENDQIMLLYYNLFILMSTLNKSLYNYQPRASVVQKLMLISIFYTENSTCWVSIPCPRG